LRIGSGHDTHRLEAGRPLLLGGVCVPSGQGAVGHSDADVVLHALTDAVLGAAALGDIGELYPDTDPQWRGADSAVLLRGALQRLTAAGFRVGNVDVTVFLQEPKLGPHKAAVRANLARLLGVAESAVSVKAKTGERVGHVGRGEAVGCHAVVLVEKNT
jgi:2-C-methyl-D-erythritol 2,4-cyclodiphosphate synthase